MTSSHTTIMLFKYIWTAGHDYLLSCYILLLPFLIYSYFKQMYGGIQPFYLKHIINTLTIELCFV